MSDLHRVVLRRKQIITSYDSRGKATGTRETFIEETHNDLPSQLVATYRRQFPAAFVSAEIQPREHGNHGQRSTARTDVRDGAGMRSERRRAASAPREAEIHVGDYAAAVNAAVKREVRA